MFYYFRLEDQVPETHLLRLIEKHISFEFVRERLKDSYSNTGRPSIDPVVGVLPNGDEHAVLLLPASEKEIAEAGASSVAKAAPASPRRVVTTSDDSALDRRFQRDGTSASGRWAHR